MLLAALDATVGLSGYGWAVGVAAGVVTNAVLALALTHHGTDALGPANRVTLARATLVGCVAALVADSFVRTTSVTLLVTLAAAALLLDAADGWVARRTEATSLGARFDMEVDAFLILVLSVHATRSVGAWVLAIGAARYAYYAAGWLLPWLRGTVVPPRYWCKVVAAIQGIVLTITAADVLPRNAMVIALAASLALLAESFGHEAWWLSHRRDLAPVRSTAGRRRAAHIASPVITVLAGLLVWFALVAPNQTADLTPLAFAHIPIEGLLLVALILVLPQRAGRVTTPIVGIALGLLTILKILDMGFFAALGRPFHPVIDWAYFGSAVGVLGDSIGRRDAIITLVAVGALCLAVLVLMPLSVRRLTRLVDRHRGKSIRAVTALGVVWTVCAAFGLQLGRVSNV
ncbi:MAG: CDP-alcohol phosphatidyltransferase, partial [Pseudonocardiales bacterium]